MSTLSNGRKQQLVRDCADFIVEELPEPDETFVQIDIVRDADGEKRPDWVYERFFSVRRTGLLTEAGTAKIGPGHTVTTWAVPERVYECAESWHNGRDAPLPCGHKGLSNCGDYFECYYEGCDQEFSREEGTF